MKATENVSHEVVSKMSDLDDKFQDFNKKELIENDSVKRKVPNVFVSINGKKGDLSVEEVRNLNKFFVNYSEYSNPMGEDIGEITSFFVELTIRKKVNGETLETTQIAESNDGKFTDEIRNLLKNAEDGYQFHFKNISFKMKKEPFLSWNVGEIYITAIDKRKLERWGNLPITAQAIGRDDKAKYLFYKNENGDMSVEAFKKITELHFHRTDYDYSGSARGESLFTINRVTNKGGNSYTSNEKTGLDLESKKFSEKGRKLIQAAEEGDVYQFSNIRFTEMDKKTVGVPNITFYIKKNDISDEKPIVCLPLGGSTPVTGGEMKLGIFQNIDGLMLKNNPKKEYLITQFHIYKIAKSGLVSKVILNEGNALQGEARTLVEKADYADAFYFKDVMVSKKFSKELENYGTLHFTMGDYSKNPDLPIPQFAERQGGMITKEAFLKYSEVKLIDPKTGKESKYELESFILVHVPRKDDPRQINWSVKNQGGLKTLLDKAEGGDSYNFMSIKVRYSGSLLSMDIGGMNFFISDNLVDGAPNQVIFNENPRKSALPVEKPRSNGLIIPRDTTLPILTQVDEFPHFQGGQDTMFKWLSKNIRYPTAARSKQVEGTVYVGFVVETDGSISNVTIKREPFYPKDTLKILEANGMQGFKLINSRAEGSLGREAKRVVLAMPKWVAGRNKGRAVRVACTLPIKFKLE